MHPSDIEKHGILGKLLAAHRVPSACNAHRLAVRARGGQRRPQRRLRIDGDDAIDARGIDLRMYIIDEDARVGALLSKGKESKSRGGPRDGAKRLASCRHFGSWGGQRGFIGRLANNNGREIGASRPSGPSSIRSSTLRAPKGSCARPGRKQVPKRFWRPASTVPEHRGS